MNDNNYSLRVKNDGNFTRSNQIIKTLALLLTICLFGLFSVFYKRNDVQLYNSLTNVGSQLNSRITYSVLSDADKSDLFDEFMETYGVEYTNEDEYDYRLTVFKSNLELIDSRNSYEIEMNGEAIHGITKFSDLTPEEFEEYYLMEFYDGSQVYNGRRKLSNVGHNPIKLRTARTVGVRVSGEDKDAVSSTVTMVDWTEKYTTAIKNQGSFCRGASYVFACVEQVESDAIRKGLITISDNLSVQQILSCNKNSSGCFGGSVESCYAYVRRPGSIYFDSNYPYSIDTFDDTCYIMDIDASAAVTLGSYATVTRYHNEPPQNTYSTEQVEENMLAHLIQTGTLHACVDASLWSTYQSGVMSACPGESINHCVQIVGVYFDSTTNEGYYKIRNSWGSDWGDDGYIYLKFGVNACDISYNPGYTDPANSL